MEEPLFWHLVGSVHGARVLDLGCGDARLGVELIERGAHSYHGVDPSPALLAHATEDATNRITLEQSTIEDLESDGVYDRVVSRLALHYVSDLTAAIATMAGLLAHDGALIYTLEHPNLTSHESELSRDDNGFRGQWVVDDYFHSGRREIDWFNGRVVKFHRPLEDHVRVLRANGLTVTDIGEGLPQRALFGGNTAEYDRRMRIPLFLGVRAERMVNA